MQLYVETIHESEWAQGRWREIADAWEANGHLDLCDSMDRADAILTTIADPKRDYESTIKNIAVSRAYRVHPDKCFVFDTQDSPLGLYAGLYSSLRGYLFSASRHRTGCYMQSFNEFIRYDTPEEDSAALRWLFSFQGNLTSRTRAKLFEINYGRNDVLVERTEPFWSNTGGAEVRHFKEQYADNIVSSKFVLCPRGVGTSTYRLFETMQSGRVPVILSDAWVPTRGIDWPSFSLRIRERDLARVPEICLANEERWESLARQARRTWEDWFSPAGMGRLVRANLESIADNRRFGEKFYRVGWPVRTAAVSCRQALVRGATRLRSYA